MDDSPWVVRRKMPLAETMLAEDILAGLGWRPSFGLILGIGEIDEEVALARRTLASLREQVYGAWRVTILRRGRVVPSQVARRLLEGFDDIAARVDIQLNVAADVPLAGLVDGPQRGSRADLIGVLLAGDVLSCDALLEMAITSGLHAEAELFYSDEVRVSPVSGKSEAFFKPDWSPDLLTATNYIGRFWCALPKVFNDARLTMGEWFQFGDYELVLRCTEATSGIWHVPKALCERGRALLDHSDQERAALARAMQRRRIAGDIRDGRVSGSYRLKRAVAAPGMVSIVIATRAAQGLVKTCIETLRAVTARRDFEIICVENIPPEEAHWRDWLRQNADKIVTMHEPFNWSRYNNLAARQASGEFLVFLNDDMEIVDPNWLDALLEHAQRPEIGVVGARLLYPDRTVQHAGMFWTPHGGRHAFRGMTEAAEGYFGLSLTERNVIAATGACLAMRRAEFEAQGGFDETHTIVNNDVDFCLRSWERNKRVVYTPYATLIHHEVASREELGEDFDAAGFAARWSRKLQAGDPYYHPLLTTDLDDYSYAAEPLELVYSSRPLFDRAQIRNVLAVKLDHIGDFITAIPALRRLREAFPNARLHLLVAPASAALAAELVPGLAHIIEFEFFFAQSGLGQREVVAEEWTALQRRLAPHQFDLAIDLRKWPETRPVLQVSGARWFAGFDNYRQFPWLDVVMQWEEDPAGVRKQSHVSDDLIKLIDAVANAARPDDGVSLALVLSGAGAAPAEPNRGRKRFVCVHPGVGSAIRQWPTYYFAALIDRLVAVHDVEIVLIGTRDEAGIAAEVMAQVQRPSAVRLLAGKISLRDLPAFLVRAALFIGNNSGPKHLAASLGVPTLGIHSGTVDAREWGPNGRNAVAVRRNMVCSPCYLSNAADCPRDLACLTELRPAEVYEIANRLLAIDTSRDVGVR